MGEVYITAAVVNSIMNASSGDSLWYFRHQPVIYRREEILQEKMSLSPEFVTMQLVMQVNICLLILRGLFCILPLFRNDEQMTIIELMCRSGT